MQHSSQQSVQRASTRNLWFELIPLLVAGAIAWWSTVRPGSFSWLGTRLTRGFATVSLIGLGLSAWALTRNSKHFFLTLLLTFVLPCIGVWVWSSESAAALLEPVEILVGGLAWVTLGLILIRPQSVRRVRFVQTSLKNHAQANEAFSSETSSEDLISNVERHDVLSSRHAISKWASVPLLVAMGLAIVFSLQALRVSTNAPDRAILARVLSVVVSIGLLSTASEWVESYFAPRVRPSVKTRLSRAFGSLIVVTFLILAGLFLLGHELK